MRIVVLSDLHVGSMHALWPRGAVITEGEVSANVPLNKTQQYLLKCWYHMVKEIGRVDVTILNGDIVDGENPKEIGHELSARKITDQVNNAVLLVAPLRECSKKLWVTQGTPYHDSREGQAVESFAEAIQADKWPNGARSGSRLWQEMGGKVVNASHHITRGWMYPASAADRTAMLNAVAASQGKLPAADIIIRSHLHLKRVVSAHGRKVIMTPAWKLTSNYSDRTMEEIRAETFSDLGGILIEITPRGTVLIDDETLAYQNPCRIVGKEKT